MSGNICLVDGLRNNVTNFLSDELSLQKKFYQELDTVFEIPFKMYDEIKDLLDGPDIKGIGNIFTKSGLDMVEGQGLDLENSALYSSTGTVNPITYKTMCKKIEIFRGKLKLKETFKNVPNKDIRIVISNANKDIFYDSAKLRDPSVYQYEGNEGLNLPSNATSKFIENKINECHAGRVVFSLAETSQDNFAVTTSWSGTLKRLEHRVARACLNDNKIVGAIIAISIPA